jgi:hypothetical protein
MDNLGSEWPMPFSGITTTVTIPNRSKFRKVVTYMINGCGEGHEHNIGVQIDGNVIHTTDLGVECINRALRL